MKSKLRLADLYALLTPGQPRVSPDGRRVAYVVQGFRKKENDRYQNLWMVAADGSTPPHRLTRGATRDTAPAWSPDGRYLAFLSTREHELEVAATLAEAEGGTERKPGTPDKPQPQLWLLDTAWGGEPRQLTRRDEGVAEFDWSPDGRRLVFSSRDPEEAQKTYLDSIRGKGKEGEKGPLVIDRIQHKQDGSGYLDDVKTHLFIVDVDTRQVTRLTGGSCNETAPRWSPDGRWIAFTSNRTGDADNNHRNDLWLIGPDGAGARRLTAGDVGAGAASWSPDARSIAFVSSLVPENYYLLRHLLVVEVDAAEAVDDLAACVGRGWSALGGVVPDRPAGDVVSSARAYPVPLKSTAFQVLTAGLDRPVVGTPVWLNERELLFPTGDRGQTRLAWAGRGDRARPVFPSCDRMGNVSHDAHAAGGVLVLGMSSPSAAPELYAVPLAALEEGVPEERATRLTYHNTWLEERLTARYERITFPSSGNVEVEALCALPPGFDPAQAKAPLLVKIHGGPMSYDGPDFRFDVQHWAGQGYLVLMVNYRGSISYGEEFCQVIQGDWGPREHDDVMHGVQAVLDRGWVDADRMYCTGFSQGGIMTNWAVGHTGRFRAAASEHGMWDYVAAFGTDDCHRWWQDDLGVPWQNPERYRRISPAVGVENIRTPLLITAGELDWRCPLSQSEQLYLALKKRGVPTRLVIYQGERHAITSPRRALDRICRILRWFADHGGLPLDDDSAGPYPDPS